MVEIASLLLDLAVILTAAKIGGELVGRIGQPAVLGELMVGVLLGPSLLGLIEPLELIKFLAEIGLILLLFKVGLESDITELMRAGSSAGIVALTGLITPFILGYAVALWLGMEHLTAIFIGATLTATSIGITARVLADLNKSNTRESTIILGAAVLDDIGGLVILSIVVSMVTFGAVSAMEVVRISISAIAFLALAMVVGIKTAPRLLKIVQRMQVEGRLIVAAFAFCLFLAWFAEKAGLATIVGAFAAGLILAKTEHRAHIEERIEPMTDIFVPIFFVMMGVMVDIKTFLDLNVLYIGVLLTAAAILGKMICGLGARGKVNRLAIGVGMLPRGEVGLIFAGYGITLGIIDSALYSALILLVIITTFLTPIMMKKVFK
jgi:Kef-type K+ transport system membrane component KefB